MKFVLLACALVWMALSAAALPCVTQFEEAGWKCATNKASFRGDTAGWAIMEGKVEVYSALMHSGAPNVQAFFVTESGTSYAMDSDVILTGNAFIRDLSKPVHAMLKKVTEDKVEFAGLRALPSPLAQTDRILQRSNLLTRGFNSSSYTRTATQVQKVLILRANFVDKLLESDSRCTLSSMSSILDVSTVNTTTSMAQSISISSYGLLTQQTTITPTVRTATNISSTSDCNFYYNWSAAVRALWADTYTYTNYDYVVTLLPTPASCFYAGIASVTPSCSGTCLNLCLECTVRVIQHETGHNMGLQHSGTPGVEYGDNSDIMGVDGRNYNELKRFQLGFLPPTSIVYGVEKLLPYFTTLGSIDDPSTSNQRTQMLTIDPPSSSLPFSIAYRTFAIGGSVALNGPYCGVEVHQLETTTKSTLMGVAKAIIVNTTLNFTEVLFASSTEYAIRTDASSCATGSTANILIYPVGQLPTGYTYTTGFDCLSPCSGSTTSTLICTNSKSGQVPDYYCTLTGVFKSKFSVGSSTTQSCSAACASASSSSSTLPTLF